MRAPAVAIVALWFCAGGGSPARAQPRLEATSVKLSGRNVGLYQVERGPLWME